MDCPVCLEALEGRANATTPCSHAFHADCLGWWLERATTCPCCRTVLAAAPTNPSAAPQSLEQLLARLDQRVARLDQRAASLRAFNAEMAELAAARATREAEYEAYMAAKRMASAQRSALARAARKYEMQFALSKLTPAEMDAREAQRTATRSAAAKRGAATRAANRVTV
jgi:hypothetical protein